MKILRIEDNKGFFRTSEENDWQEIDEIDKDDLMALLDRFLKGDLEMDSPDEKSLSNQAQQIIYKSIFDKFNSLQENRNKFEDESKRKYSEALRKYSENTD